MTGRHPRIRRGITTATEAPTRLNRPDVAPADSTEGGACVESVVEPAVAETPILITEQEVLLSTAAAVTVPARIGVLRLGGPFMRSTADERAAKHKQYPHHYVLLDQALMAREMERC
jgi:hypothetical protein